VDGPVAQLALWIGSASGTLCIATQPRDWMQAEPKE